MPYVSIMKGTVSGEIKRLVVGIHGGGDHSGYFRVIGPQLASDGNQVYAIDLRGFGNSQEDGLPRGDTSSFKRHLQDLDDTLGYIRRNNPGKKIYLLGHSMGGCYALWYATNYPDSLDGLVLAAPAIIVRMLSTRKALILLSLASIVVPRKMFDPFGSSYAEGRDAEVIATMLQDPLGTSKLSYSYLASIRKILMDRALKNASFIEKPTLILQGDADISAIPYGARRLYESLKAKDKSLQTFPSADHNFYGIFSSVPPRSKYDTGKIKNLFSVIMNWLNTH